MLRQFLASLLFASFAGTALHAQATATAERPARIQIGAGVTMVLPDYEPKSIFGYSIYGDFDFARHIGIEGSIHMATVITPTDIGESSYLLGPRYVFTKGRFRPYAKALLGIGVFTFQPVYVTSKSSSSSHKIYAFGGGVDYTAKHHLNVRVIDMEYQGWPSFGPSGLTPFVITAGAAYNF